MVFADTSPSAKSGGMLGTFLRLTDEHPVDIYILDSRAAIRWSHWLPEALRADRVRRGLGITCPGPQSCPVCIRNAKVKTEAGENYRKHPEFRVSRKRFLTNVMNVTLAKTCACGAVYLKKGGAWPTDCTSEDCKASLVDVGPARLNRIQVLESGPTLFNQFNAFSGEGAITDSDGNPIPLQDYMIRLTTSGKERDKTTIPVPMLSSVGAPTEDMYILPSGEKQEKYDLTDLVKPFTPDEIKHLMEGGSVADIYEGHEPENDEKVPW